jgi:hypothetical protein
MAVVKSGWELVAVSAKSNLRLSRIWTMRRSSIRVKFLPSAQIGLWGGAAYEVIRVFAFKGK